MGRHERYVPQGTAENPLLIWVRPGLGIAGPVPTLFSVRRFRSRTLHGRRTFGKSRGGWILWGWASLLLRQSISHMISACRTPGVFAAVPSGEVCCANLNWTESQRG